MLRSLKKTTKYFFRTGHARCPDVSAWRSLLRACVKGPRCRVPDLVRLIYLCVPTQLPSRIGAAKATRHSSLEAGDDGPARRWPVLPRSR